MPDVSGNVYNVGNLCEHHRLDLIVCAELTFSVTTPIHAPPRTGDVRFSRAVIDRTGADLGYDPQVSFEDGLKRKRLAGIVKPLDAVAYRGTIAERPPGAAPVKNLLLVACIEVLPASAADPPAKKPVETFTDATKAGPDYQVQGEYVGEGPGGKGAIQVVAEGDGQFACRALHGGLPGDGWERDAGNTGLPPRRSRVRRGSSSRRRMAATPSRA